jgi:beta-glucosidase
MQGRTYRYFQGTPLYSFGYGLSYTTFSYSKLKLPERGIAAGQSLAVEVTVTNSGTVAGDEVAQLYLTFPDVKGAPLRALRGFERVRLKPGESRMLHFNLKPRDLSMVSDAGEPIIAAGKYSVLLGGGQANTGAPSVIGVFQINGQATLPE